MLRRSKWMIPMVVRWDVMLLAAVLAGASMLIESSNRLDTGAPDEEIVGASTCTSVVSARVWKAGDDQPSESDSGCTPE